MRYKSLSFKLTQLSLSVILATTSGLALAHGKHRHDVDYKDYKCECEAPCPPPCPPCPCPMLHDGFYVGGAVGYDIVTSHGDFDETARIAVSGSHHLAATGWDAGLFAGYGMYFDCFYLGGEGYAYWSNSSHDFNITTPLGSLSSNIRHNWNYGLAILPGFRLNNATTAYVRLGWDWANVKHDGTVTTVTPPATFSGNHTNTRNGFIYGVGMETLIACNWSLRADYTYVNYNNDNDGDRIGSRIHPSDNRFAVGIVYHFC